MTIPAHTMLPSDVGRVLGLSAARITQLDHELHPIRIGPRHHRRYDPRAVEEFARRREAKKSPAASQALGA